MERDANIELRRALAAIKDSSKDAHTVEMAKEALIKDDFFEENYHTEVLLEVV